VDPFPLLPHAEQALPPLPPLPVDENGVESLGKRVSKPSARALEAMQTANSVASAGKGKKTRPSDEAGPSSAKKKVKKE
jgi:hypothetical protein